MSDGVLIINKERGFTSFDVCAAVRKRIFETKKIKIKVGHTGTLDPEAKGVLVLCLGKATRLAPFIAGDYGDFYCAKEYEAQLIIGTGSATDDIHGEITQRDERVFSKSEIALAAASFADGYEQEPPIFSAKKIKGRKLYKIARSGVLPSEIKSQWVNIRSLNIYFDASIKLGIECGAGTYIRSLCRDIGQKLGSCAVMGDLTRTRSGRFSLKDAAYLSEVLENINERIITPQEALPLSELNITPREKYLSGAPINICDVTGNYKELENHKLFWININNKTLGLYRFLEGELKTEVFFGKD